MKSLRSPLDHVRILVAGKGFIGTSLGERLQEDHQVEYLDRSGADYQRDITQAFNLDHEFDVLIHTIGLAPGFKDEEEYRRVHVSGTRNLINCVEADHVVYLSALGAGEVDHSFFRTKKKAEDIVRDSGMIHTIIRPSTVSGRGNKLLEMIRSLAFTRIFPDISTRTQPIAVEDLSDLMAEILEMEEPDHMVNAAGPLSMTIGEMARELYHDEGYRCVLMPAPQVILEWSMMDILPPPFHRENRQLLRHDNTTGENHALQILGDLRSPF